MYIDIVPQKVPQIFGWENQKHHPLSKYKHVKSYPLVICYIAIENGPRNS